MKIEYYKLNNENRIIQIKYLMAIKILSITKIYNLIKIQIIEYFSDRL